MSLHFVVGAENKKMNDKKYLLREFYSLCEGGVCQDLLTESEKMDVRNGAMILTGIAQRADYKNQNGRIYPYEILAREVENYKKLVRENRSIGECVDEETEIFTTSGWKYIKNIAEDEEIFTLDTETDKLCVEKIQRKVVLPFDGKMLHFRNNRKSIDMKLTPNHNILAYNRYGKKVVVSAQDAYLLHKEGNSGFDHSSMKRKGGAWDGDGETTFSLPNDDRILDRDKFSAFMGIYIAEGCSLSTTRGFSVALYQTKEEIIKEIRSLLESLPFHFTEYKGKALSGERTTFIITDKQLKEYLSPLGKSYEKYIPQEIKTNFSSAQLEVLLKWFLKGDGRNRWNTHKTFVLREGYTTSPQLASDLNEVFLKIGTGCSTQIRIPENRLIEGRTILKENSRPLYVVCENTSNPCLSKKYLSVEEVPYKGDVYCVTTKNGNWLMRRNNAVVWTKNCDHPDNTVISLQNASHKITDIWWNAKDVMIKLRVLSGVPGQQLRSLVNDGVAIGLSSRGLGSVRETREGLIVESDFNLICFDIVSEPSTQAAFMTLAESKQPLTWKKEDRIQRALNEVLFRK